MQGLFDGGLVPVEINGNKYHLPAASTKALRIKAAKEWTAWEKAQSAHQTAGFALELAGVGDDLGAVAKAITAAEVKEVAAASKLAEAAVELTLKLLTPVGDTTVPSGLGDHIADDAAMAYAMTLARRSRVELDPQ